MEIFEIFVQLNLIENIIPGATLDWKCNPWRLNLIENVIPGHIHVNFDRKCTLYGQRLKENVMSAGNIALWGSCNIDEKGNKKVANF